MLCLVLVITMLGWRHRRAGGGDPTSELGMVPQVTQLYVPASRHVWRFRRMGRIGPLQSTLDGECPGPVWVPFPGSM